MEEIIAIIMVFSIPLSAILGSFYLKLQRLKIEQGKDDQDVKTLRQQVGYLMAENEEMQDRLKNVEYLLSQEKDSKRQPINMEYQEEKIKADNHSK